MTVHGVLGKSTPTKTLSEFDVFFTPIQQRRPVWETLETPRGSLLDHDAKFLSGNSMILNCLAKLGET